MGFWGSFVLVRGERPPVDLEAFAPFEDLAESAEAVGADGWYLVRMTGLHEMDMVDLLPKLIKETGRPVLSATIADSGWAVVYGLAPRCGVWETCLHHERAAQEGLDTSPRPSAAIAERAVEWAREAGFSNIEPAAVLPAMEREEVVVEEVVFHLLETLGIRD
jgi:hypothetical protein